MANGRAYMTVGGGNHERGGAPYICVSEMTYRVL